MGNLDNEVKGNVLSPSEGGHLGLTLMLSAPFLLYYSQSITIDLRIQWILPYSKELKETGRLILIILSFQHAPWVP